MNVRQREDALYNPINLSGKLVLVTGASSGIGREVAIVLSRMGARLILSGRRFTALEETRAATENSESHLSSPFDLTDLDGIPHWVEESVGKANCFLDGAVHCAGIGGHVPLRAVSRRNIESVMATNVHASIMLLRGVTAKSVARTPGMSVVLISSAAALVASPSLSSYTASKAALHALARSASKELAGKKVRINCIAPSYVRTPMFDKASETIEDFKSIEEQQFLGIIDPEEVGVMAGYLLSNAARSITGSQFVIDGGFTL
jgi:NAD(P)-dependent dehydrogenase (short-subunit alcohol dehydrogenase family)